MNIEDGWANCAKLRWAVFFIVCCMLNNKFIKAQMDNEYLSDLSSQYAHITPIFYEDSEPTGFRHKTYQHSSDDSWNFLDTPPTAQQLKHPSLEHEQYSSMPQRNQYEYRTDVHFEDGCRSDNNFGKTRHGSLIRRRNQSPTNPLPRQVSDPYDYIPQYDDMPELGNMSISSKGESKSPLKGDKSREYIHSVPPSPSVIHSGFKPNFLVSTPRTKPSNKSTEPRPPSDPARPPKQGSKKRGNTPPISPDPDSSAPKSEAKMKTTIITIIIISVIGFLFLFGLCYNFPSLRQALPCSRWAYSRSSRNTFLSGSNRRFNQGGSPRAQRLAMGVTAINPDIAQGISPKAGEATSPISTLTLDHDNNFGHAKYPDLRISICETSSDASIPFLKSTSSPHDSQCQEQHKTVDNKGYFVQRTTPVPNRDTKRKKHSSNSTESGSVSASHKRTQTVVRQDQRYPSTDRDPRTATTTSLEVSHKKAYSPPVEKGRSVVNENHLKTLPSIIEDYKPPNKTSPRLQAQSPQTNRERRRVSPFAGDTMAQKPAANSPTFSVNHKTSMINNNAAPATSGRPSLVRADSPRSTVASTVNSAQNKLNRENPSVHTTQKPQISSLRASQLPAHRGLKGNVEATRSPKMAAPRIIVSNDGIEISDL